MKMDTPMFYLATALVCASIGSLYDLRSCRIPNRLTGPAILVGILLHYFVGGASQMASSVCAGLIAGGAFFLFFLAGGMGAGDVKLMAAVGCLAGPLYLKDILLSTVISGALMGIALALYRGRLRQSVTNVMALVQHHSSEGLVPHPELNLENSSTLRLPYALPIATGCTLTFLLAWTTGRA